MRRALGIVGGAGLAVVVAVGVWFVLFVSDDDDPKIGGLGPAAGAAFGEDGTLPPGPSRAVYSPDGTRLAVVRGGRVFLARQGRLEPVTEDGGRVVDVAWFPNSSTLLVAEGPVATGLLAVVDIDGTVRGSIPLSRQVGFGSGHGMAVATGSRRAALTVVDRPPLADEQRRVVEVALDTGEVRDVSDPGGDDEFGPAFLDDGTIVFSTPERMVAGVVGGAAVVVDGRELVTADGDVLGRLPDDVDLADLAPTGDRAVVVSADRGGQPQLREIALEPR